MNRFKGKVTIVSGGSKGIGLACAKQMAVEGARLFLVASNPERLASAAESLNATGPAEAAYHAADLRTLDGCNEAVNACLDQFGGCDIFIHSD